MEWGQEAMSCEGTRATQPVTEMTWRRGNVLSPGKRYNRTNKSHLMPEGRTMATRWKFQQAEQFQFKEELSICGTE